MGDGAWGISTGTLRAMLEHKRLPQKLRVAGRRTFRSEQCEIGHCDSHTHES